MMYCSLNEIFDAILSLNEDAAYEFAKKFSSIAKKREIVLFPNVQYLFGDGKYSAKFEEAVRDGDAMLPIPDMLYLYENTEHGWVDIGEAILV